MTGWRACGQQEPRATQAGELQFPGVGKLGLTRLKSVVPRVGDLEQLAHHCEVLRPTRLATVAAVHQHVLKGVTGSGVELCHVKGGTGHKARWCRGLAQGTKVGSVFSRVQAQQRCSSPVQVIGCEA